MTPDRSPPEKYLPLRLIIRNLYFCLTLLSLLPALWFMKAYQFAIYLAAVMYVYGRLDTWAMPNGWVHSKSQETATCWRYLRGRI